MITYEDMLAFAGLDEEAADGLSTEAGMAPVLACGLAAWRRHEGAPVEGEP